MPPRCCWSASGIWTALCPADPAPQQALGHGCCHGPPRGGLCVLPTTPSCGVPRSRCLQSAAGRMSTRTREVGHCLHLAVEPEGEGTAVPLGPKVRVHIWQHLMADLIRQEEHEPVGYR